MNTERSDYTFTLDFSVRDYECDLQGIVNNSVYQNYFEHTRHQYLHQLGVSFAGMTQMGIYLVVTRAEIDYKMPLRSGDQFWIGLRLATKGRMRAVFTQHLVHATTGKLMTQGVFTTAAMDAAGTPMRMADVGFSLPV